MRIMRKAGKGSDGWQYEAMNGVRKQMPKPSHQHEDDEAYDRRHEQDIDSDLPTTHELMTDATSIASIKGHMLGNWKEVSESSYTNSCLSCGKQIIINSDPLQAELDIDGLASKEDCE
jgi:hypothetical protein